MHRMPRPLLRALPLLALPLLAAPLLGGCQQQQADTEEPALPFVFRSLNLRQQDPQGRPAWQLTSPEARYDLSRKVAQARELRGIIFSNGQPLYRLSATSGTVLNDGALIQLEGEAILERVGPQPVVVRARRVRWYPRQERMELDQRPTATDRDLQITADRALFLLDQDKLELRGSPAFSRRPPQAGPKPQAPADRAADAIVITASRADWFPTSGKLEAPGPVRAERRLGGGQPPQVLTSPFLGGNTLEQRLVLQGPVRFLDPAAKAQMVGGETVIELGRQAVLSQQPFTGSIDKLQLAGAGFELLNDQTLAVIPSGCVLNQPGETLTAQRCQWNWTTQAIEARQNVVLRRQANEQVTRASQLDGRLGADGLAVFTSPQGRVKTRVRVPGGSQGSGPTAPRSQPGAARPPIGL